MDNNSNKENSNNNSNDNSNNKPVTMNKPNSKVMEKAAMALRAKSQKDRAANSELNKKMMAPQKFKLNEASKLGKVIAIASGKGGVGKSTITALLACSLKRRGAEVGIIDADVTGPSIPHLFGLNERILSNGDYLMPVVSSTGISVMSVNLMLDDVNSPVVWRGPVMADLLSNFWTATAWGDLDYMLIDLPPGTGDVPLTVFQSFSVDGMILVTSPQDLVSMVVSKASNMAVKMEVPIMGLIENYAYFECPDTRKRHYIFGESHCDEVAKRFNLQLWASLPIDQDLAKLCDTGEIEKCHSAPIEIVANNVKEYFEII